MNMGYSEIMIFQGGMPEWVQMGYPTTQGAQPGKLK